MLKHLVLTAANMPAVHHLVTDTALGRQMASRFVAGDNLDAAMPAIADLNQRGIHASLDYLGENTSNAAEATKTADDYVAILDRIAATGADANISIKLTALGLDIGEAVCLGNVRRVLERACALNIFVRIDMEGSVYTEPTLRLVHLLHREFAGRSTIPGGVVGTVIQSMLFRSGEDVAGLVAEGIRVRLVKGAYREPASIAFPNKFDVDEHYRQLLRTLLAEGIYPAIATHDEGMIAEARRFAHERGIEPTRFEFQMLYGIRRDLQERLVRDGYNVRVYVPYGTQWYPYLSRRMAERPANLMFVVNNALRS
ncbi:MAG: proline dehydrogenase family protein [Ktedonobacterales bacterium]|nr:proline dehydrogenase family protein [Ktedonobacterales bacterium]